MKCRILADQYEFGCKLQEVIPEKPKMCLKSPRVTVSSDLVQNGKFQKEEFSKMFI